MIAVWIGKQTSKRISKRMEDRRVPKVTLAAVMAKGTKTATKTATTTAITTVVTTAIAMAAVVLLLFIGVQQAEAAGTTYYVNNKAGSGCSNAHAGTAQAAPWCDFTNVNGMTFGGGDRILLARGATWNQQMTINGSGTSSNWAEIGAYGTGDRPKIIRNGIASDRGIRMNNPSYWKVSDLEIGYTGAGILVWFDTLYNEGLRFSNLYVHHNYGYVKDMSNADKIFFSAGIVVTGNFAAVAEHEYAVRDIIMDNIEGTRNQDSINFDWQNGNSSGAGGVHQVVRDVILKNLYLHDDDGGGVSTSCSDSLRLVNAMNVTVMNSVLNNEAACYSNTGTAAVFFGRVQDVQFVNSMITNVPYTGSYDMSAFDYEYRTERVNIRNNYIAGNAGPGVAFLDITCGLNCGDFSRNHLIAGNVFALNGYYNGGASIVQFGQASYVNNVPPTRPSGVIRDNLYHEPNGTFTATDDVGSFSFFTFNNNRPANSHEDIHYAPIGFTGTQGANNWSYQYRPGGGSWTNLPSYSGDGTWYYDSGNPGRQAIYRFEQTPGNCATCDVARVWQAPANGFVSIRGLILKSDTGGGDGVVARITKNGTRIWPASGDQYIASNNLAGVESNLDQIAVAAGDIIRFEVGSNGTEANDRTSWAPTVAYTSVLASTAWEFNTMWQADGWAALSQSAFTVWGGINTITSTGSDPYMESPDNLGIDASKHRYIRIRMKNNTSSTIGQLYFQRNDAASYTEDKSIMFATSAYDGDYKEYVIDMWANGN